MGYFLVEMVGTAVAQDGQPSVSHEPNLAGGRAASQMTGDAVVAENLDVGIWGTGRFGLSDAFCFGDTADKRHGTS